MGIWSRVVGSLKVAENTHFIEGLGGIAILVLDISYRKIPYLSQFLQKPVLLGCFNLFMLIWFCKYQAFVFSGIAITNLFASKEFSRHGKTAIIPKAIISLH